MSTSSLTAVSPTRRPLDRVIALLRRVSIWQWAFVLILAWYVWHFTNTTVRMHHGLGTSSYDFALYDQGMWLLSRFKAPFVTLMGRNLFGDHTSFIMLFLVPFYWVFPGPGTLLFFQSAALAAGAIPVFLYARRRLGSEPIALLLAGSFLLHPAIGRTNVEQFHPDAFLPALVGFAIYFALNARWVPYAVFVLLSLLVKEDVALVIIPLGLWVALRRDRRIGFLTIAGAILYALFAMGVVIRLLNGEWAPNAWRIPFGGVGGLIAAMFTRPGEVISYLVSDGRPWYLLQVAFSFGFVFLLAPALAAISSVVLGANVISVFPYQYEIRYHYTAVTLPALGLASVEALGRIPREWRTSLAATVVAFSLLGAYWWGTFPFSIDPKTYWSPSDAIAQEAAAMFPLIPDDAVISVYHNMSPHLAHREHIYMFPNPFSTLLYGDAATRDDEGRRLPIADDVEYVLLPPALLAREGLAVWQEVQGDFEIVAQSTSWELWRRNSQAASRK